MGRKVVVTHLSKEVRRSELKELFNQCGKVVDIWVGGREAMIVRIGIYGSFWTDLGFGFRRLIHRSSTRHAVSRKPLRNSTSREEDYAATSSMGRE
jgi:hypothetical protein